MEKPIHSVALAIALTLGCLSGSAMATLNGLNIIFTVNSTADSVDANPGDSVCADAGGHCTLRAAVMEANALTGEDTIEFAASTNGTPIKLTLHGTGEDAAATGDLDVTNDLTIIGNGEGNTIIDGDAADRVFEVVNSTTTLNLSQLTVRNGGAVSDGGGILDYGTLTLNSVSITNNQSTENGGGLDIYTGASFAAVDSTISINSVVATGASASGGGLLLGITNAASIRDSAINNNTAHSDTSQANGGGVYAMGKLEMQDCTVRSNTAQSDQNDARGGGFFTPGGYGGSLTLSRVEVSGNVANAPNGAGYGGGINSGVPITLTNTTIASNQGANVGGIYQGSGLLQMNSVTISRNSSSNVGGVFLYTGTSAKLSNTLIANNTGGTGAADCRADSGVTMNSLGYNLIGDASGCSITPAAGDQFGTTASPIDPKLGALASAGGNGTRVMAPLAGSPAIDAGDPLMKPDGGTCTSPDQVGDGRPVDGNGDSTVACDIGAYEYHGTPQPQDGLWIVDAENNSNNGRGFQIETRDGTQVMTYYGYLAGGADHWYLAAGSYNAGSSSFSGAMEQYLGGTALGGAYQAASDAGSAGTVSFSFDSATTGTVTFPGEAAKAIEKFAFSGDTLPSVVPENGLWIINAENNGNNGRGFQIEQHGGMLVFTYYGYDSGGQEVWFLANGSMNGNTFTGDLNEYSGGTALGGSYSAATASGSPGQVTLTFTDSTTGTIQLPGEAAKAISKFAW